LRILAAKARFRGTSIQWPTEHSQETHGLVTRAPDVIDYRAHVALGRWKAVDVAGVDQLSA
jgi:hypothetical protein